MRWIPEQTEYREEGSVPPAFKRVVYSLTALIFAAFVVGILVVSPVLAVLIGGIVVTGNLFNWS